jgi:hypothetical protein
MFPHLPFKELLISPTHLYIPLASYLHFILKNPSHTNNPNSNPHQITVQAIRKPNNNPIKLYDQPTNIQRNNLVKQPMNYYSQ